MSEPESSSSRSSSICHTLLETHDQDSWKKGLVLFVAMDEVDPGAVESVKDRQP